jgi:hypothetical protein
MATLDLREGDTIDMKVVTRLAKEAIALNSKLGDPAKAAR